MQIKSLVFTAPLFLAISFLSFDRSVQAASASRDKPRETYTGTMVGVGGWLGGVSRSFTLTIEGRTSDAEAARDVAILAEGGQDALLDALRDKRLGRFSLGGQLGRDVNFVLETTLPNGDRRITILFERWLNLYEVRYGARSQDYPFSYVELVIDRSGKGQGTFIPAARVRFHGNQVEVENFGVYPARLFGVRSRNS
jgi:hypothetical protein